MDDSPTQRGSWDGARRPTTTRSHKPRGVDPVKVKRHSTQRQTRQRHYFQNTPSEEMDDSPTQRDSWDGAPRPTTTRPLKPRGVDHRVKAKRHLKKTGERPPLLFLGRLQDLAIQEFTGMATVLKSKNLTSSIKDLEGDTAWRQQISQGILSRAEMKAWADLFPRERWRSAHHL